MEDPAKVTISRRSNSYGSGTITITIDDGKSSLRVVDVEMTFEDFAQCITGHAACPAEWNLKPNAFVVENIGKARETKRVKLNWRKFSGDRGELDDLIKPHLVDGWMLRDDGMTSQQNSDGHVVVLYRFLDGELAS